MKHVIEEIGSSSGLRMLLPLLMMTCVIILEKMVLTGTIDYCYPVEQP